MKKISTSAIQHAQVVTFVHGICVCNANASGQDNFTVFENGSNNHPQ